MAVVAVVGAQWGDEGKGKIVDILAAEAAAVVRFQGGNNAGHTLVVNDQKMVFHLIPSGILHPGKTCILGQGMVINPRVLLEELDKLEQSGHLAKADLKISDLAHVILPHHLILDRLREEKRSSSVPVGSTLRGIGPTYEDKVGRRGVRIEDLLQPARLRELINEAQSYHRPMFEAQNEPVPAVDEVVEEYSGMGRRLEPLIADTTGLLHQRLASGDHVLLEGAQGTLLDVDHGTYPYVTSSNTVSGAVCAGAGVGPTAMDKIVAVVKAYVTRVGNGPFPTEDDGEAGEHMRKTGAEFGSTTGRPRRCGWFDAVGARRTLKLSGATGLALTKLDVLSGLEAINVCIGYELEGKPYDRGFGTDYKDVTPVYRQLPGWSDDITQAKSFGELPAATQGYVNTLAELVGCPVDIVSVGPGREQTIIVNHPFG